MSSAIRWVHPEKWAELTGRSLDYLNERIRLKEWAEGVHYKRTSERTLWLNLEAIDEWVQKLPCVASKDYLQGRRVSQKGSRSAAGASA